MKEIYPLTIISDRYDGTYSGGRFLAFNLEPKDVPDGPLAEDVTCAGFWAKNDIPAGRGATPEAAVTDLRDRLYLDEICRLEDKIRELTDGNALEGVLTELDDDIEPLIRETAEKKKLKRAVRQCLEFTEELCICTLRDLLLYKKEEFSDVAGPQTIDLFNAACDEGVNRILVRCSRERRRVPDIVFALKWWHDLPARPDWETVGYPTWWRGLNDKQRIKVWRDQTDRKTKTKK